MPTRRFRDPVGDMMLELLSTGSQIAVSPSIHPSGEPYQWWEDGPAAEVSATDLFVAVTELAVATLLLRNSPHNEWLKALQDARFEDGRMTRILSALDAHSQHAPASLRLSAADLSEALSLLIAP